MPSVIAKDAGASRLRPAVVVTGGSEGIGRAIAARFAKAGRDVVLVARSAERLAEASGEIGATYHVNVDTIALDITAPDAPASLDALLAAKGAFADVLVNNAGVGLAGEFTSHAPDAIAALIDLNVRAMTLMCRHFLPEMRARKGGGIINLASLGGFTPGPYEAVYYASKAYVLSLSEALAAEVSGDGVRITAIAPGPITTAFHARMGSEADFYYRLLPQLQPAQVARWAYAGYRLGMRVVVPGVFYNLMAASMRLLPHRLVMPVVAWLLWPRNRDVGGAGPKASG